MIFKLKHFKNNIIHLYKNKKTSSFFKIKTRYINNLNNEIINNVNKKENYINDLENNLYKEKKIEEDINKHNIIDKYKINNLNENELKDNIENDDIEEDIIDTYPKDRIEKKEKDDNNDDNGFVNRKNINGNKYKKFNKNENINDRFNKRNISDGYSNLGNNLKDIDWNNIKIKTERQNLFQNNKILTSISNEDFKNELKKNDIYINQNLPNNYFIKNFSDLNFHECILNYLNNKFNEPTTIQKITWPIALAGKDLIGIAETGSGKTLAYILPAFMHILNYKKNINNENNNENNIDINNENNMDIDNDNMNINNIYALIILPTRELCLQVLNEIQNFEKMINIKSVALYGGVPKYSQINNVKKGVDIIVCTPGRLLDFLENGIINLLKCIYVVIDEADRLLDMGFEKQLRKILSQVNKNKQLLYLTATWPEQVRKLAYDFCSYNPIKIQIGKNELTANKNIEQSVVVTNSMEIKKKLLDWLKENYENNKILIFCDTKRNCDNLCRELRYHQFNALAIHGDKQQRERDRILNNYKTDKCNILVATDVASRGLDIKNISVVINYDIPNTIEDYIHRIGRTGRAGNKGKSILFFSYDHYVPQKKRFAREIIKLMNKTNQPIPNELKEIVQSS